MGGGANDSNRLGRFGKHSSAGSFVVLGVVLEFRVAFIAIASFELLGEREMISDDQIIEIARKVFGRTAVLPTQELIAFARLIEKQVREEDARICDARYLDFLEPEMKEIAAAIRNSGGAA